MTPTMASTLNLSSLRVLFWNANGISKKIDELRVQATNEDYDIIMIQEAMFTGDYRYNIANYTQYRLDRIVDSRRPHGGLAIYVHRKINHYQITDLSTDLLESLSVMVLVDSNTKILVSNIYVRHGRAFPIDDFKKILYYNNKCIIAGDYNAHNRSWNCKGTNHFGKELQNLIINNNNVILYHPPTPTHYPSSPNCSPSTIDLALCKNLNYPVNIETLDLFSSDHMPVLFSVDLVMETQELSLPTVINWNQFHDILAYSSLIYPFINNSDEIETAVDTLTKNIQDAIINSTIKLKRHKVHRFPPDIRKLIAKRNALRKLYQHTRLPAHRQEYYSLQHTVREKIRAYSQDCWSDLIQNLKTEDNSLWRLQKIFKTKAITNFPPIHGPNGLAFDDQGKADNIAIVYQDQFSPNYDLEDEDHDRIVHSTVQNFLSVPPTSPIEPATCSEIIHIIQKLKNKKSPGNDNIKNLALKNLPPNIIIFLTGIVNAIIKFNYFPSSWKTSIIAPIPKPHTDHAFPENYRPISLLCSLSKITERVIQSRMNTFLNDNNILIPEQFGFRNEHSTIQQLFRVVDFAAKGLKAKKPTGAVFLDIAKAFDKVYHPALIFKLIKLHFPDSLTHFLHNYLRDRHFVVRVKKKFSTPRPITAGILQGSVLGPILFNIYVNDIPRDPTRTILALYADDTCACADDHNTNYMAKKLQHHLDLLEPWFIKWKIKVNTSKCHAIFFSHKRLLPPRLYLFDEDICWENSVTYLGVVLDRHLTWLPHIKATLEKCEKSFQALRTLFYSPHLSLHNKTLLYKTCVLPIATYAAPVWAYAAKTNLGVLDTFHNKTLNRIRRRRMFMSNLAVRRDLNMPTFYQAIHKVVTSFYKNLPNLNNEIIAEFDDYDHTLPVNRKRPRASLLVS